MSEKRRTLIAMSGGVDSSVAAYIMRKAGYDCEGVTLRLTRTETAGTHGRTCCSEEDIDAAAEVAFELDMPYRVLDCEAEFRREIIEKFVRVYEAGETPNPCIDCNRYMKFGRLVEYAVENGFDCVASGHYARVERDAESGRFLLKKGLDPAKDQSYFLYSLTQEQLSRICFPLGGMTKSEVRDIAEKCGFSSARKRDSQDICFVPDGDYGAFLERFTGRSYPEGDFVAPDGRVLGRHRGAVRYTLGQRRGLGVAAGERIYVYDKDMKNNIVRVGPEELLFRRTVYARDMNWVSVAGLTAPTRVRAKTRYSQREQAATAYPTPHGVRLEFDEPQRAVTPGQALVLYVGDAVLGGGTICGEEKA